MKTIAIASLALCSTFGLAFSANAAERRTCQFYNVFTGELTATECPGWTYGSTSSGPFGRYAAPSRSDVPSSPSTPSTPSQPNNPGNPDDNCNGPDRDHDDNGHGNDDDHDDDSNPGNGGGNHGQGNNGGNGHGNGGNGGNNGRGR